MLAWILILGFWIALLFLVLHDATKDDSAGSALAIVAKRSIAVFDWAASKARRLGQAFATTALHSSGKKAAGETEPTIENIPSEPVRQAAPPAMPTVASEQPPAPKKKWWRKDGRASITVPELELAITEAVRRAGPGCEAFVGVVVRPTIPRSALDVNWELHGVKFGKADRRAVNEALPPVIERMRKEFRLSES
jgi:hypothetical protein